MKDSLLEVAALPAGTPVKLPELSRVLDGLPRHAVGLAPWPSYAYRPQVQFAIAHYNGGIVLKYFVREAAIRAVHAEINGPVWQDSCVEFFLSFDDGASYYNLEFNCIGTGLIGYGTGRQGRTMLPPETVASVQAHSVIRREHGGEVAWELTLLIPLQVFAHTGAYTLGGRHARANFYKCGDALPEPHYLSWAPIHTPEPDFHRPEFFGTLRFA